MARCMIELIIFRDQNVFVIANIIRCNLKCNFCFKVLKFSVIYYLYTHCCLLFKQVSFKVNITNSAHCIFFLQNNILTFLN